MRRTTMNFFNIKRVSRTYVKYNLIFKTLIMLGRKNYDFNMFVGSVMQYRIYNLMETPHRAKANQHKSQCKMFHRQIYEFSVILIYLCTEPFFVSNLLYLLLVLNILVALNV